MDDESGPGKRRQTMSMGEAAALVGLDEQSVRRWIDANEPDDGHPGRVPVADRERDDQGRARPGSWRRPYRDAVEAWARQRAGGGVEPPEDVAR